MRDLVVSIVKTLVDHPRDIRVAEIDGQKTSVLELRCHPEDLGKVIGKNGKTISAIRTIANTLAAKDGKRAVVEVVE